MYNSLNIQIENLTLNKIIRYNENILYQLSNDSQHGSNAKHDETQKVIRECLVKLRKIRDGKWK